VKVLNFNESIWDAMGVAAKATLDEYMDDPLFAKVRGSVEESMRASSAWIDVSEGAYRRQRDRVLGG